MKNIFALFLLGLTVLMIPLVSRAQNIEPAPGCFGVVDDRNAATVSFSSDLPSSVPGALMSFTGVVTNPSSVDISNAPLYVRVYASHPGLSEPVGIDAFVAASSLTVPAGGTATTTFTWRVPQRVESGSYYMVGHVSPTITPFIAIAGYWHVSPSFLIIGEKNATGSVFFTPNSLTLGNWQGRPAASNAEPQLREPVIDETGVEPVEVVLSKGFEPLIPGYASNNKAGQQAAQVALLNTTNSPFIGSVRWRLYSLDDATKVIREWKTPVAVNTHASTTVSTNVDINVSEGTGYYVEAALIDSIASVSSFIGLPLVAPGGCEGLYQDDDSAVLPTSAMQMLVKYALYIGIGILALLALVGVWWVIRRKKVVSNTPVI